MRVPEIELPEMELGQAVATISTIAGVDELPPGIRTKTANYNEAQ